MIKRIFKNIFKWVLRKKNKFVTVMLIGVDNAGKTTLFRTIQGDDDYDTMPTVGFDSEVVKNGKYKITYFDLGGGTNIRDLWKEYYANVHGAIFVVDSADPKRFDEARDCLFNAINHEYFKGKSILILANKQDLPGSTSAAEISEKLHLHDIESCSMNIVPCVALTKEGDKDDVRIDQGLKWLCDDIWKDYKERNERVLMETKTQDDLREIERKRIAKKVEERKEARKLKEMMEKKEKENEVVEVLSDEKEEKKEIKKESKESANSKPLKRKESWV